jgi:phenylacetate-CoA ligase
MRPGFLGRAAGNLWGLIAWKLIYPLAECHQKRVITPKLRVLRAEAANAFATRRADALNRLAEVLEHAGRNVPYYRDLFSTIGFEPAKVRRDARYLELLPYLTKDILREQGKRLVSETHLEHIYHEQKTGSSTGPAAIVYYDREAADWTAAQNILMMAWAGQRRYNREAHLSTRFKTPTLSLWDRRFEIAKFLSLNRAGVFTDGFGDTAQERLLADLKKAKARSVQGRSSSLFALARWFRKRGLSGAGLFEFFVSTGEMMSPAQRALIEEVFQVRASDRYGACEFGVMAQELAAGPRGEMLVSDSLVWRRATPSWWARGPQPLLPRSIAC